MEAGEGGDQGHGEGQRVIRYEGPAEIRDCKFVVAPNSYTAQYWHLECVKKYLKIESINMVV